MCCVCNVDVRVGVLFCWYKILKICSDLPFVSINFCESYFLKTFFLVCHTLYVEFSFTNLTKTQN